MPRHPTNRTERRAHKLRQSNRVRVNWHLGRPEKSEDADLLAIKFADTRCPCAKCCANPRKYGHLPVSELRLRDVERDLA